MMIFGVLLLMLGQYSIRFGAELQLPNDARLTGARDSVSIPFMTEAGRTPIAGSRLHLFVEHSGSLDEDRSFLSVSLNYGILRSLRLGATNQNVTEVIIPLPPEMLRRENELVFSAEQFSRTDGSDDIWTAIKPNSFIEIAYEDEKPELDLRKLPAPLLDQYSYREKRLSVLLPRRASAGTLEAAALLIANYASAVAPSPVTLQVVRSINAARDPLLAVGTTDELPNLPSVRLPEDEKIGPDDGVIALTARPANAFAPVLVVTGETPQGVLRSARALAARSVPFSGPVARISADARLAVNPPRQWRGFLPPRSRFTLADVGLDEQPIETDGASTLAVNLNAHPDAQFLEYGHEMNLVFRTSAAVKGNDAVVEVHLNDTHLGTFSASAVTVGTRASMHIKVPADALRPRNVLNITWRLPGEGAIPGPAAWLLPTSEFYFPRDYRATLPNLSFLQSGLFPIGLRSDLSDAVIVLPNDATDEATTALFELSNALGRLLPTGHVAFRVRRLDSLGEDLRASSHLISLETGELPGDPPSRSTAALQESLSPWNSEKFVLTIRATSLGNLPGAVRTFFSSSSLEQFEGDTAYLRSGAFSYSRLSEGREVYDAAYLTHVEAWLRENWIALPLILVGASALLFVALRLALGQYKNRRTATEQV